MDKNLSRFLTLILCSLIVFSCADDPPLDKKGPDDTDGGGTDPTTSNDAVLFFSDTGGSDCAYYLYPEYMKILEISVWWIETTTNAGIPTDAEAKRWGKPRVYRDANLGFGDPPPTFKVPSDGKFFVSVRIELKCVPCCPDCSQENPQNNFEGRGEPVFTGQTKNYAGGSTEVDVDLEWIYCNYCNCTEPEEYN